MSFCKISTITVFATTLAAVIVTTPSVASATDCTTGRNKRAYDAGVLTGKSIVNQAWNGVGQDPDAFDQFKVTVENAVNTGIATIAVSADDYVRCRAKGLAQGSVDQIGEIQGQVTSTCLLDGDMWGEFSADLYCALATAFDGLDVAGLLPNPPDGLCGTTFETSCHAAFSTFATTPVNQCVDYSVGPAFVETQQNMCIY